MNIGFYFLGVVFLIFSLGEYEKHNVNIETVEVSNQRYVDSMAAQFISYSNYVRTFLQNNPGATGMISDSRLAIPAWFGSRDSRITNNFIGGTAYVVCSDCPPQLESAVSALTENSFNVGIVLNGKLIRKGLVDNQYNVSGNLKNGSLIYVING